MFKKTILKLVLVSVISLGFAITAFAGDTLEFVPVGVYWNTACSSSGYANLCGKNPQDDWYFVVKNKSNKTLTSGTVFYILLVDTRKLNNVMTGATLDLFRKFRISSDCLTLTATNTIALEPNKCAFMGKVGGVNTLEWADVPIFDYQYMSKDGIIRAGVRINWTVRDSYGFSDSGSYTYYPEILTK